MAIPWWQSRLETYRGGRLPQSGHHVGQTMVPSCSLFKLLCTMGRGQPVPPRRVSLEVMTSLFPSVLRSAQVLQSAETPLSQVFSSNPMRPFSNQCEMSLGTVQTWSPRRGRRSARPFNGWRISGAWLLARRLHRVGAVTYAERRKPY